MSLGPDNWNNAPDASEPVDDIRAYLSSLGSIVGKWPSLLKNNADSWNAQIGQVQDAINRAIDSAAPGSVFLGNAGKSDYLAALDKYQSLKDRLTLSQDIYLTGFEQSLTDPNSVFGPSGPLGWLAELYDKLMAAIRLSGGIVGVALAIIVLYLFFVKYKGGKG